MGHIHQTIVIPQNLNRAQSHARIETVHFLQTMYLEKHKSMFCKLNLVMQAVLDDKCYDNLRTKIMFVN